MKPSTVTAAKSRTKTPVVVQFIVIAQSPSLYATAVASAATMIQTNWNQ